MNSMQIMNVIGTVGGGLIAFSLVPQVWKTYQTQSTADISYAYQGIYILGTTLVNAYALSTGLWPVYVPCLFEELFIVVLTLMKYHFDAKQAAAMELTVHELNSSRHRNVVRLKLNDETTLNLDTIEITYERQQTSRCSSVHSDSDSDEVESEVQHFAEVHC
jgi:uncharacterized protein with PQ loop repeat